MMIDQFALGEQQRLLEHGQRRQWRLSATLLGQISYQPVANFSEIRFALRVVEVGGGAPFVPVDADRNLDRHLAQEGDFEIGRTLLCTAVAKNIVAIATIGAGKVTHILDQPQYRN